MAKLSSKDIVVAAVLAILSLAIPIFFHGTFQIVILGIGYSATLASHVPVMLSAIFGPLVAAIVSTASAIGFFGTLGPIVGSRAATHVVWAVAVALAVKKGMSFPKALFLVGLPIHGLLEGLVVLPFGVPWQGALINVAGASIQHVIDSIISIAVFMAASPLMKIFKTRVGDKKS
jgi:niacin transporter